MTQHSYFQGQRVDFCGEGVYVLNEGDSQWYQIGTFDEVAYQLRLGRRVEWVDPEGVLTIEVDDAPESTPGYEVSRGELEDALRLTLEGVLTELRACEDRALTKASDSDGATGAWALGRYEGLAHAHDLIDRAFEGVLNEVP